MDYSTLPKYPGGQPSDNRPRPEDEPRRKKASAAWFRLSHWLLIGGSLAFLPLTALGVALGLPVCAGWLVFAAAFICGSIGVGRFRCPRCDRDFTWSWGWKNPFTRRCVHCGHRV